MFDAAFVERFNAKVDKGDPNGCWLWLGAKSNGGYGSVGVQRRPRGAHRVAYEIYVGTIPTGLTIDHLCKNPPCVNPAHLEAVTERENLLRGDGWAGQNHRKTHCPQGHPLTGDNVQWNRSATRRPYRYCRYCSLVRKRRLPEALKRAPNKSYVPEPVCDERCGPLCESKPDGAVVFPDRRAL